jgi:hypothetical protein
MTGSTNTYKMKYRYVSREVHISLLRSAGILFQEVHADTMGSIPDDDMKYGDSTLGSTCLWLSYSLEKSNEIFTPIMYILFSREV